MAANAAVASMSTASTNQKSMLIVGAGLAGAVTSSLISRAGFTKVSIWEKSRGAGGRMSTSRATLNSGSTLSADLGAQYFSQHNGIHNEFYRDLLEAGLIDKFGKDWRTVDGDRHNGPEWNNYVAPKGVSSVVKHFLAKSGANVIFGKRLASLNLVSNDRWHVTADDGTTEDFDAVVLTMPVPQILEDISGNFSESITSVQYSALKAVQYSSRFALGLFYEDDVFPNLPWVAKYIKGNPVIVYISIDSRKRNQIEGGTSVVVHTSVPYGIKEADKSFDEVTSDILEQLKILVPGCPEPSSTKCLRWKYSQVRTGFEGSPGAITLSAKPPLILAGDAFSNSGFDGCIDSGVAVLSRFSELLSSA